MARISGAPFRKAWFSMAFQARRDIRDRYPRMPLRGTGYAGPARSCGLRSTGLNHDARVAQVLIAVDQIDLPHLDEPAPVMLHEAMAAPAG